MTRAKQHLSRRSATATHRRPSPKQARAARRDDATPAREDLAEFDGDSQFATTLARGLEILRCFTPEEPALGNKALSDRTGLAKPTVSRFTYTLCRLGYLRPDYRNNKYQLGPAVVSIVYPLLASISLRQIAQPSMKRLADEARGSVSMSIRDRLNMVYVETCRSSAIVSHQLSDIGLTRPIARVAMGRAYLAGCAPSEREAILNEIQVKTPGDWRTHRERIFRSLADYDRLGFCMSFGDFQPKIHAVAVPFRLPAQSEVVVFNCALHASLLKPGELERSIGPRLAAMVKGLGGV